MKLEDMQVRVIGDCGIDKCGTAVIFSCDHIQYGVVRFTFDAGNHVLKPSKESIDEVFENYCFFDPDTGESFSHIRRYIVKTAKEAANALVLKRRIF